jgi:hypothetical protein
MTFLKDEDPRYRKFYRQRAQAKWRGIPWQLEYWEWLQIWDDSGRFQERGTGRGQWVMARFGDVGPYASGNVRITRAETNNAEAQQTRKRLRLPG